METVISSTKSHLTCLALTASLGLALSACAPQSSDTKSPEASKADQTVTTATSDGVLCEGFGPQTPRDISSQAGLNLDDFQIAPPASDMNLCNIHTPKRHLMTLRPIIKVLCRAIRLKSTGCILHAILHPAKGSVLA